MTAKPHFRRRTGQTIAARLAKAQQPQQYSPLQVAKIYGLPLRSYSGEEQTIGIIELGGAFYQADLSAYLRKLGLPDNQVQCVNVAGGSQEADPGGADVEVMLDVCIVAALAPAAKIKIYFGTNDDAGMPACINQAVADGCDVISISWGSPESQSPSSYRAAVDAALQKAVNAGVSVYVAAGDNGSSDGTGSTVTDYPASSPFAVGCGGTNLQPDGTETVWNDGSQGGATGGGYSGLYSKPAYQQKAFASLMRGVPDVAGNADPETGWLIQCNGSIQSVGGTSAVAPMWAAIHALLNQQAGKRIGFSDVSYYSNPQWFNDTISGSNGAYSAGPGWDACTGLGSPKGTALFAGAVATSPPPSAPPAPPAPPAAPTIQQAVAVVDADFAAFEQQIISQRPFLGPVIASEMKVLNAQIDSDLEQLSSTKGTLMKDLRSLPKAQANAAETHAMAIDNIFGLPPGTILGVITKLLPVIEQIWQVFGGTGGTTPAK